MAGPLNDILVDDAVEIGVGEGKICEFITMLANPCVSANLNVSLTFFD